MQRKSGKKTDPAARQEAWHRITRSNAEIAHVAIDFCKDQKTVGNASARLLELVNRLNNARRRSSESEGQELSSPDLSLQDIYDLSAIALELTSASGKMDCEAVMLMSGLRETAEELYRLEQADLGKKPNGSGDAAQQGGMQTVVAALAHPV